MTRTRREALLAIGAGCLLALTVWVTVCGVSYALAHPDATDTERLVYAVSHPLRFLTLRDAGPP